MIQHQAHPRGGFICRCTDCGQTAHVASPQIFAQRHRCTHYGAGDMIARATGALGIKPCSPCEARKRKLNGMFPRVWGRR